MGIHDVQTAFQEVHVYSMGRPGFILQHVVDAFAVQTATSATKRIAVVFGLVGLYLHVERRFSGREVQKVHMKVARKKREWPEILLPDERGSVTILDVLAAPEGTERDRAIEEWCSSVWLAFASNRETIVSLLREYSVV
jgi:hypothetical protein